MYAVALCDMMYSNMFTSTGEWNNVEKMLKQEVDKLLLNVA